MDVFVARQPIFDRNNDVIAYELLFRNGYENFYNNVDGDKATLNVISNSFCEFDFKSVTDNKKGFINFTGKLIKEEIATILPSEYVVIEILENIEPTDEILIACRNLKEKGFVLALDDFVFEKKYSKLIEVIDIIKVDFIITKGHDREKIFDLLKINNKIKFLAEKVENIDEYNEAMKLGYAYFQGYYFSKPTILSAKRIPFNKYTALKILKAVSNKEIDLNDLEKLILEDVGLSYKIMKLINSSSYYLRNRVHSIKYAIALLGEKETIKWLYVVLLNDLKGNKPDELIKVSLQRAKFCEIICNISIYKEKEFEAYLTGLFSVMDAILNCSMEVVVKDLYISDEVKDGLIDQGNTLNNILKLAINYEKGKWDNTMVYARKIEVDINKISEKYLESLEWADNII